MSDLTETDFPPLEPQPFVTEEGREIERLRAELAAEGATTASLLRIIVLIREAGGFTREDLAALPGAVKAMRQQRDEAVRALKEIAHQDYRGHPSTESQIAMNALAAMREGDAHGK